MGRHPRLQSSERRHQLQPDLALLTPQAVACAEAKAKLISPFVGRILDWYKKSTGKDYTAAEDPGVISVKEIYAYKKFGHETEVMGASFRNTGEIIELAGCDLLTISPQLLGELQGEDCALTRQLSPEIAKQNKIEKLSLNEKKFRLADERKSDGHREDRAEGVPVQRRRDEAGAVYCGKAGKLKVAVGATTYWPIWFCKWHTKAMKQDRVSDAGSNGYAKQKNRRIGIIGP